MMAHVPSTQKLMEEHGEFEASLGYGVSSRSHTCCLQNKTGAGGYSGMVVHTCKSSSLEVKEGGSEVQGYSWLRSQFGASLGHMKSMSQKQNNRELESWLSG